MKNSIRGTGDQSVRLAIGVAALLLSGGAAAAQSASSSLSSFSKGAGGFESPVNVSTRDANGNMTIVNGVMQAPQGSIFSNLSSLGASSSSSGAGSSSSGSSGSGSATAIGNNLNVVVNGDYNTVIVNSSQTNNGNVSASTVLNGKVNLDGGQ
jgi:holdfast attachment protein HfaA